MSHELTIRTNGRAEMAWTGDAPWHGLGQQLPPGASLDTWRTAAGLDWQIARAMVRYPTNPADAGNPAAWRALPDRHVLLRSDTGDALGIVSDRYQEVQPDAILDFFRDVTAEAGFTMETAGTLYGGKRMWALARIADDAAIADRADKVGGFLLLATSADGSMATEARFTTVRVVCRNTLGFARAGGKPSVKVAHRETFDPAETKRALGIHAGEARDRFAETMATFRRLASVPASRADMVRLTLETFGHRPDTMTAAQMRDAAETRAVAMVGTMATTGQGLIGADLAGGSGTAWAWLNAVTQYADHAARARTASNRLDSAWFGRGAAIKERALELAVAHADGTVTTYAEARPGTADALLDAVIGATRQPG